MERKVQRIASRVSRNSSHDAKLGSLSKVPVPRISSNDRPGKPLELSNSAIL